MPDPLRRSRPPKVRLSLAAVLALAIGALVVLAVGVVLLLAFGVAVGNTNSLLVDKARLAVTMLRERLADHLRPAEDLVEFVAARIERGDLALDDEARLSAALSYTLAAASQLGSATVLFPDGGALVAAREDGGRVIVQRIRWRDQPHLRAAFTAVERSGEIRPMWGEPLYIERVGRTIIPYLRPIYRDGRFLAAIVASLPVAGLAAFLGELGEGLEGRVFVLYGRERVLAHPSLQYRDYAAGPDNPLPTLAELDDAVLAAIWSPGFEERRLKLPIAAHDNHLPGAGHYYYLYATLDEGRSVPWIVGAWFRAGAVAEELMRLWHAGLAAGAAMLVAVLAAVVLARRLAAPIGHLAETARRVAVLDLDGLDPLPAARVRELDDAARAFNGMVAALRAFARYVPRDLVRRLMRTGRGQQPESRVLTIMFTDLAGFTGLAETLDPAATATLVREHFAMLGACIEEEGGTVDKFMGDGVMAFWGAPEPAADHAQRAVRAAERIAERHLERRDDPYFLPLRIGIHTGTVLVGEIETPARVSYTLVGDAVNTAARLQDGVRDLLGAPAVGLLMSGDTRLHLGNAGELIDLGEHVLRGRANAVRVFGRIWP